MIKYLMVISSQLLLLFIVVLHRFIFKITFVFQKINQVTRCVTFKENTLYILNYYFEMHI